MSVDWSSFYHSMKEALSSSMNDHNVIISPYITTSVARDLLSETSSNVTIITNWSEINLLQGISDLDLYNYCQSKGIELRVLSSLHAKLYLIGANLWIGSANLTSKGMQLALNSNDECMTVIENPSTDALASIDSIIKQSILVNDSIYSQYKTWLDSQEEYCPPKIEPITMAFDRTFTTNDLPQIYSPYDLHEIISNIDLYESHVVTEAFGDLGLLRVKYSEDLEIFLSKLKVKFFQLPLVQCLLDQLTTEWTRFGGMRTMIREACGGRNLVSRDDVTKVTQNLYEWIEDLDDSDKFEFGVPRHSQLIRLNE